MDLSSAKSRILLLGNSNLPKEHDRSVANVESNLRGFRSILSDNKINFPNENIKTICDTNDNIALFENIKALSKQAADLFILYYTGLVVVDQNIYLTSQSSSYENIQINGISLQTIASILTQVQISCTLFILDVEYHYIPYSNSKTLIREFKNIRQKLEQSYFLVSNSENDKKPIYMVQSLKQNLYNLENISKANISLEDIYDFVGAEHSRAYWFYPFIPNLNVMVNKRYLEAQQNLETAHNLLEKGQWQEALSYYNDSAKFDFGAQISTKIKIIESLQKAQLLFEEENYKQSKDIYEVTYKQSNLEFIQKNIISCHEKIAEDYFKRGALGMANKHYRQILKLDSKNNQIKNKVKNLNRQINFLNLAQQADQAFYDKDYEKALEYYTQIENIDHNPVLKHRKDMAATFIEYRKIIKADLELEFTQRIERELQKKQIPTTEKTSEADTLNEKQLWKRVADCNESAVYSFFISLFPAGKYGKKAKRRLAELASEKTEESPKLEISVSEKPVKSEPKPEPEIEASQKPPPEPEPPKEIPQEKVVPTPEVEPEEVIAQSAPLKTEPVSKTPKENTVTEDDLGVPKPKTEADLWQEAKAEDTLKSYLYYISTTQEGTHLTEAYEKVSVLS